MFQKQIGTSMEVYLDDMLVKSVKTELHVDHLAEAFQILKDYKMKLNPTKCAFGVSIGKFLGFIVNSRGIRANPKKKRVVLDMQPPSRTKEIQRLIGRIAALSRFVSRSIPMPAILSGSKKGLPLGHPMRRGVLGIKNLPKLPLSL